MVIEAEGGGEPDEDEDLEELEVKGVVEAEVARNLGKLYRWKYHFKPTITDVCTQFVLLVLFMYTSFLICFVVMMRYSGKT